MKNQVKKQNKNCIISCMLLIVAFLSLFLSSNFLEHSTNTTAKAESTITYDTNFMYAPSSGVVIDDTLLVLDSTQNSIIKIKDNVILQGENTVTSAYGADFIYNIENYLILLKLKPSNTSEMIRILRADTFEEVIIAQSLDSTLIADIDTNFDKVSTYMTNNTLYLLLYSLDANNGLEDMLYFSITLESDTFTISSPRKLTINTNLIGNNFASNIKSLSIVYNQVQGYTSCLVHSNSDVFGFDIKDSDEISSLSGSDIDVASLSDVKNIYTEAYGDKSYIIFEKQTDLEIYELIAPSVYNDKFSLAGNKVSVTTLLPSIDNVSLSNNQLVICSIEAQMVATSVISSENEIISLNSLNYASNPNVKNNIVSNSNIKLMEITSDTNVSLTATPYASRGIITLSPTSKVVEIGYGEIYYGEEDAETIEEIFGYKYFLATVNGTNYYGYLPISQVTELETEESEVPYAFTKKNVNIYKYPSNTVDDTNTILYTLPDVTKVELVNDISEFTYTVGTNNSTRSFYEVRYNDEIGYILATDIDSFPEIVLVQTNATVLRQAVVYENLTDELPTWSLSEGARVRILENRFGNEKYTKIAFNDDDGVTCTGYILADSIQADSWTTLQIIGFVLVLLSLVLLVIILIVKHRINKE